QHTLEGLSRGFARDVMPVVGGESYLASFATFRSSDPGQDEPEGLVALVSEDGSIQDTLLTYPGPEGLVVRGDQFVAISRNPFGRSVAIHLTDGRVYYGRTDSLAVGIYDLEGTRVGGFQDPHEPVPITESDVEHAVTEQQEADMSPEIIRGFVDALRAAVPETWPVFDRFLVDKRGRIWIDLTPRPETPNEWAIYEPDGARAATFTMPAGFEGMAVRDDVLFGVETDEFNVPSIVAYRIEVDRGG
ncbi:MAG: hypothetical protein ACREMD_09470, partial [Gemmatimonadota bacterium]